MLAPKGPQLETQPHISCCSLCWDPCDAQHLKQAQCSEKQGSPGLTFKTHLPKGYHVILKPNSEHSLPRFLFLFPLPFCSLIIYFPLPSQTLEDS